MELEIIPLAQKKIKQRKIPQKWIEETVNNPDQIVEGYGGRRVSQKIYQRDDKKVLLRVILEGRHNRNVVVSAYITTQLRRYWRTGK